MQGHLLDACGRVLGERVRVTGASRTDAGVHALRQVASLSAATSLAPETLARALNAQLPPAIRVTDAARAPDGFDARRWATGKRYAYLFDTGPVPDPFLLRFAWHPRARLDPGAMAKALRAIRGTHDFSAFCAAPGRHRAPTCTVRSARLCRRGSRLVLLVSADSFLHHMMRNLIGSLVEVGRGARPLEWIAEVLASRDRSRAGPTAPPQGLTLVRVLYPAGAALQPARP